ncbi:MAG TPA: CRISPR-associated endoribonuclease Cas6 [Syntrophomonadaceae bacterium]|nr:CRISPR-associated endoribonuclease Cas6 [Syntrophomonadaceae bacterium]
MLQKIILECQYDTEQKANYNWGSLFHGVLLEALPSEVTNLLHENQLKPYTQYITPRSEHSLTWTIGMWDNEIASHIIPAIMSMTNIELKHKNINIKVIGSQRLSVSKNEYFHKFFTSEKPCRRYEIEFLTPCSHKQQGEYVLFPTPDLIINSLSRRYNAYISDISLDDSEALQQIARNIKIVRYSLRSAVYYLESTKITGYMGKITIVIRGPEQLARLAGALLSFAEYSGIGIKTALGMGGIKVKEVI